MTAIAAVVHRGQVWMASDSRCSTADMAVHQRSPKIRLCGSVLIGSAGDGAAERVVPLVDWAQGPDTWAAQLSARADQLGVTCEFELLVGSAGRLYYVEASGEPYQAEESYAAAGSGALAVLGYLAATAGRNPADRVRGAVRAAIRHVPSCGGRIHLLTLDT